MTTVSRRKLLGGAAGVVVTSVAGCSGDGNGGDSSPTDAATDQPTGTSAETDLSGVEIEAWNEGNHYSHMEAAAQAYNEQYESSVNPVEKSQVDNLSEEVLLTLSSNNPEQMPGCTIIRSQFLRQAARKGGVENINGLMEEYVDQLFPAARTKHTVDGDWYSTPQDIGPTVWFYNQDLFEEAGLPTNPDDLASEIQTWEDFIGAAETVESELGINMLASNASDSVVPVMLLSMMGGVGPFYNEDGEFQFDKQGNVRAMNVMKDLVEYAEDTWMFQGDGSYWGGYQNEEIASIPGPAFAKGFITSNLPDQSGSWRVAKLPFHSEDPQERRSGNLGGEPIMIPAALNSEQKTVGRQFSEVWNLSEAGVNAKLEAGVFPAIDIDSAEAWEREDEYFGGQQVNQAMAEAARSAGPSRYAPNPQVEEQMMSAIREILENDADIEDTLSSYHDSMVEATAEAELEIGLPN